jgi:hypothetical protein
MKTMTGLRPHTAAEAHLRAADPAAPMLADPRLESALDALGARITAHRLPTRERRSLRRLGVRTGAVLTALTLGLVGGGVAVAGQFSAHTGIFGWDGAPHSEWLRPDAPDFLPVARSLTASIPFAPGDSAENYWWIFLQRNDDGSITQFTDAGVKGNIAGAASCSWQRVWLSAHDRGDKPGMRTASQRLHQAAKSRAMHDNNGAGYTKHLIDAADSGDIGPLQTSLRMACPQPKAPVTP